MSSRPKALQTPSTPSNPLTFERVSYVHLLLLRMSGLLSLNSRTSVAHPYSRLLSFCSHFCESLFTATYVLSVVRNSRESVYDVERIAETVGHCGGHSRFLVLYLSRGRIAEVLDTCRQLWSELEGSERRQVVAGFVDRSSRLVRYYGGACAVMCVLYVLVSQLQVPLVTKDGVAGNDSFQRSLPYAFFVEVKASPYYEITVFLQTICILFACTITTGVDTTAPFLIMMACGHLKSLSLSLDRISSCRSADGRTLCRNLITCIRYHQKILKLCQQINTLMSLVFILGLMSTTYNMSLIGLKLIGDDPDKYKCLAVLVILLIQLLICQWAPDVLVSQSKDLADHAYFFPSFGYQNRDFGKLVHIMIMRCQMPIQLRAVGYVKLSMECFGSMITSAMSFFTVLSSVGQR